jgi:Trypsin
MGRCKFSAQTFPVCLLLSLSLSLSMPAQAIVGTLDTDNQFPFVVQLKAEANDGARWSCSGAVSITGLVSTAAHCVWDPEHGRVKRINVVYTDADGISHTVPDHKIFYPKEFELAYSKWFNSKGVASADVVSLNFHLMSVQDIAFIVPADSVEVEGFPHWGTELLDAPSCAWSTDDFDKTGTLPPERCRGTFSETKMKEQLGDYAGLRAMAVGYGIYFCNDYGREQGPDSCKSDGRRRYVEVPLVAGVHASGRTFAPPELWCTGQNDFGVNPVQHGDSGGPRFIRARDGRWFFVGYTSGGNNNEECASSIFMHLDLWREAATYKSRIHYHNSFGGAQNWMSHQLQRFLSEYLESWSGPNSETIPREKTFQNDWMNGYTESDKFKSIVRFAERWPKRRFRISAGSSPTVDVGDDGDSQITAEVEWRLENPATNDTAEGTVNIKALVRTGWPTEAQLAYGVADSWPYFSSWKCTTLRGGNEIEPWGCHKASPPHWTHNGSIVRLSASGTKRDFYYVAPRQGLLDVGVRSGTLLFSGRRSGNSYSGTAYIFNNRCGPIGYAVTGDVGSDDKSVTLHGQVPRLDAGCHVVSTKDDTLVFQFEEGGD